MMKNYIFITNEGSTFQPGSECSEPDIENCQVIGLAKGTDQSDAFRRLLQDNSSLLKTSFNEIICLELKEQNAFQEASYFYLGDLR